MYFVISPPYPNIFLGTKLSNASNLVFIPQSDRPNTAPIYKSKWNVFLLDRSQDNSVGIAAGYELDGWGWYPGRDKIFLFQTGPGAYPAFYPMGSSGDFPGDKTAGAWSWSLTSI
jgi:hypothetical protein